MVSYHDCTRRLHFLIAMRRDIWRCVVIECALSIIAYSDTVDRFAFCCASQKVICRSLRSSLSYVTSPSQDSFHLYLIDSQTSMQSLYTRDGRTISFCMTASRRWTYAITSATFVSASTSFRPTSARYSRKRGCEQSALMDRSRRRKSRPSPSYPLPSIASMLSMGRGAWWITSLVGWRNWVRHWSICLSMWVKSLDIKFAMITHGAL